MKFRNTLGLFLDKEGGSPSESDRCRAVSLTQSCGGAAVTICYSYYDLLCISPGKTMTTVEEQSPVRPSKKFQATATVARNCSIENRVMLRIDSYVDSLSIHCCAARDRPCTALHCTALRLLHKELQVALAPDVPKVSLSQLLSTQGLQPLESCALPMHRHAPCWL